MGAVRGLRPLRVIDLGPRRQRQEAPRQALSPATRSESCLSSANGFADQEDSHSAFLQDEVVEQVGHAQWVFTIPKMLRVYSQHHQLLSQERIDLLDSWRRSGFSVHPGRRPSA